MPGTNTELGYSGVRATRSIINSSSAGAAAPASCVVGRNIVSGALTAATLKTLLTVSGAGEFHFLGAYGVDATSRHVRLKVTLDGLVVFDTVANISAAYTGALATGAYIVGTNQANPGPPVRFNASAQIEVSSSLTETDKVGLSYILHGT